MAERTVSNIVELAIPEPDPSSETSAHSLLARVRTFQITNVDSSIELQQVRQRINARHKALTEERLGITRKLDAAKAAIMARYAQPLAELAEAKSLCDARILKWNESIEADRREAQRLADLAASRERERLERIAAEARQKAESADSPAVKLTAESKADAFEQRAASTVAPLVTAQPARAAGVSTRANWKYVILDESLLAREWLEVSHFKITRVVKALGGDAQKVLGPGVKVTNEPIIASRAP
jgi:hypothetical protein